MASYPLLNVQTGIKWDISANNVTLVSLNGSRDASGQFFKSNGTSVAPSFSTITQSIALNNLNTPFYPNSKSNGVTNGIIAQTCDPALCNTNNGLSLNSGILMAVYLNAGSLLTNVVTCATTGGGAGGTWQFALYNGQGTRLAATNSVGVANTAIGNYVTPFYSSGVNAPYSVLTSGIYYLGVVTLTASTQPTIYSTGSGQINASVINYPQTASNTTGNLLPFRVCTVTLTSSGFPSSLTGYTIFSSATVFYLAVN